MRVKLTLRGSWMKDCGGGLSRFFAKGSVTTSGSVTQRGEGALAPPRTEEDRAGSECGTGRPSRYGVLGVLIFFIRNGPFGVNSTGPSANICCIYSGLPPGQPLGQ